MAKQELLGEVKKLITMGKEKGFLTYDELNNTLPAEVVSSDQFGSIMTMFGELDIEIVDAPDGERTQKRTERGEAADDAEEAETETEAEAEEENEKPIDLTPGALSRTDDPVRLYLKEMGSVALLSREGEIEIAKRIEEGKKEVASVIYGLPMTIEFVLALRDQLKDGKIDVREIVPVKETEEELEEEQQPIERDYEELRVKTLEALNTVRKVSLSLKALVEKEKSIGSDPAKQKQYKKQFDLARQQVVDKIESVNLHGVLKDRMVQRVRDLAVQFRMAEREVASCQRRIGIGGEAGAEQLRKMCRTRPDFLAVRRKAGVSEETLSDIKKIYQAAKARIKQLETEEALVPAEEIKDAVKHLDVAEDKVKRGKAELVEANLRLTFSIALISGIAFLGFTADPGGANWGLMVNENRPGLLGQSSWGVILPVIAIALLTVGSGLVGDGLSRAAAGIDRAKGDA